MPCWGTSGTTFAGSLLRAVSGRAAGAVGFGAGRLSAHAPKGRVATTNATSSLVMPGRIS